MIISVRHTAIVVSNLEKSKFFYESIGFCVFASSVEKGGTIDQVTGMDGVILEWVKLKSIDGFVLELLQYHSHPDSEGSEEPGPNPSNRLGCSHVCLTVDNLSELHEKLAKNGYICNSEPLISPDNKVKILYCHDPDGVILELIEDL